MRYQILFTFLFFLLYAAPQLTAAFGYNHDLASGDVPTTGAPWHMYRICSPRISSSSLPQIIKNTVEVHNETMGTIGDRLTSITNVCASIARDVHFPAISKPAELEFWIKRSGEIDEDFYLLLTKHDDAKIVQRWYFIGGRDEETSNVEFSAIIPKLDEGDYDIWLTPGPYQTRTGLGIINIADAGPFRLRAQTTHTVSGAITEGSTLKPWALFFFGSAPGLYYLLFRFFFGKGITPSSLLSDIKLEAAIWNERRKRKSAKLAQRTLQSITYSNKNSE